jgi:hypothetical protein
MTDDRSPVGTMLPDSLSTMEAQCRVCGTGIGLTDHQARNHIYLCAACRRAEDAARIAERRAIVAEINARTFCAHCGAQPIEWHNPEHVALNRQRYRISSLVAGRRAIRVIQEEMARCTPLCRRCHMREDGRLKTLVDNRPYKLGERAPLKPCSNCNLLYKPMRKGLCRRCYDRQWTARNHVVAANLRRDWHQKRCSYCRNRAAAVTPRSTKP